MSQHSRDTVLAEFAWAEAAAAPVYQIDDLMADPQVKHRGTFAVMEDDDLGPLRMPNVLYRLSSTPGAIRCTGRKLGADTDAVLGGELGMTTEELADLRQKGVVL